MAYEVQFYPYKGEKIPKDFEYDEEYIDLIKFFNKDAQRCTREMVTRVYVIRDQENNFIGFIGLTIKSIEKRSLKSWKTRGLYDRPAIVIGQLIIDKRQQGKRYGRTAVNYAVALAKMTNKFLPCRLLVVEAINEKAKKYYKEEIGFEPMPNDENTLVLDLLPISNSQKPSSQDT